MRKSRFLLTVSGLALGAAPLWGAAAGQVSSQPVTAESLSLTQAPPSPQTWEELLKERVRRIRGVLGDPSSIEPLDLKESTTALRIYVDLFGLPENLTPADLDQLQADAEFLRDCAKTDPKPPLGTDFGLVVFMHDVGSDLVKAIDLY